MKVPTPFTTASALAVILAMLVFNLFGCEQAAGDMMPIAHGAKNTKEHEQIAQHHKKQKVLHNFSPTRARVPLVSATTTTNDNHPRKLDSSSCDDSPLKVLTGQGRKSAKTCAFIADMPKKFCKGKVIKSHCPSACGVCDAFGDIDSKATFIFEDKKRECAWLHGFLEPSALWQISDLCEDEGIRGTCRYTCGFFYDSCEIEPTSSPTPFPTVTPCAKRVIESTFGQVVNESPQGKALDWLIGDIGDDDCDNVDMIIQRFVLAAFYYNTGGDGWKDSSGWLGGESECGWKGIRCNEDRALTGIDLNNNSLNGTILEEISALESLESLDLHYNYDGPLFGTIPDSIGDLKKLNYLDLEGNELTGTIPDLAGLVNLEYFYAYSNELTGQISRFVSLKNLVKLDISYNSFTGPIPDSIVDMEKLDEMDLCSNELTGTIPNSIVDMEKLDDFSLTDNKLTGTVPDMKGNPNLRNIQIAHNDLTGQITDQFKGLTKLNIIAAQGNTLTGSIPDFSTNTELSWLFLDRNKFNGRLDPKLLEMPKLTSLYLNSNELTGPIPDNFGGSTALNHLHLDDNLLTGSIPDITGDILQNIGSLSLHQNKMSGPVPDSLCALRSSEPWFRYLKADCAPRGSAQNECPSDCCTSCYVGKGVP